MRMARVTVEDCLDKVDSPYELVLVAKERATQLNSGIEPSLERDNDKNTVISLREIAAEKIKVSVPTITERIKKLQEIGVIVGFQAVIDPTKIGLDVAAIITMPSVASKPSISASI